MSSPYLPCALTSLACVLIVCSLAAAPSLAHPLATPTLRSAAASRGNWLVGAAINLRCAALCCNFPPCLSTICTSCLTNSSEAIYSQMCHPPPPPCASMHRVTVTRHLFSRAIRVYCAAGIWSEPSRQPCVLTLHLFQIRRAIQRCHRRKRVQVGRDAAAARRLRLRRFSPLHKLNAFSTNSIELSSESLLPSPPPPFRRV
jgi:hypothetical protein